MRWSSTRRHPHDAGAADAPPLDPGAPSPDPFLSRRDVLAGAAGLAGVAGLLSLPSTARAGPRVAELPALSASTLINVRTHGAVGDGTTDDTAAINQAFAAAQGATAVGVPGAAVYFPAGEYVISKTITVTRFSGIVYGDGQGQSPAYKPQPGFGSVIRWNGDDASPMIQVVDSLVLKIQDLRLEGMTGAPPTFGIEFRSAGGDKGCNHYCTIEDVTIGRYPWSTQGTDEGAVQSCIGFTGVNGNNDQFHLSRVRFSSPSRYGVFLPNTQSIWGSLHDCLFDRCGAAGLGTNADATLYNCSFSRCQIDVHSGVEGGSGEAPTISVFGWFSERTGQMAKISPNTKLAVHGGVIQCGTVAAPGGTGTLIAAFPSDSQTISLHNLTFTEAAEPSRARIVFGPRPPSWVGRVFVTVDQCRGVVPAQLRLWGSMWARSPGATSRAVVEWQSTEGLDVGTKYVHQFRNELAAHGRGTRRRLNTRVWDRPHAGRH